MSGYFCQATVASYSLVRLPSNYVQLLLPGYGRTDDIECGTDGCSADHKACVPIDIPDDDPVFSSRECLEFVRSQEVPNINCTMGKTIQQLHLKLVGQGFIEMQILRSVLMTVLCVSVCQLC